MVSPVASFHGKGKEKDQSLALVNTLLEDSPNHHTESERERDVDIFSLN